MKLILSVLIFLFTGAYFYYRRGVARKRLRALEEGKLCASCGSEDMQVQGQSVRCAVCGHVTDLAWLNQASVDHVEMDAMAVPKRRGRLFDDD